MVSVASKTVLRIASLSAALALAAGGCETGTGGARTPVDSTIPACTGTDHRESPCPRQVSVG